MWALGLPTYETVPQTSTEVLASINALNNVITTFGKTVTVAELIKAGDLSDKLSVIGGMLASYYVGAMIGSAAVALKKVLAENNSFDDRSFSLDNTSESENDHKHAND